jgi:DNA/RNA-binding domain of Phe-tRNA-synthetase-like protein
MVAMADYGRIDGAMTLDLARDSEILRGMADRHLETKEGEIVLRKEIICVLCQGADEKTHVREDTQNVLFYAYAVPDIEARYLQEGLAIAAVVMAEFGNGSVEQVEIF